MPAPPPTAAPPPRANFPATDDLGTSDRPFDAEQVFRPPPFAQLGVDQFAASLLFVAAHGVHSMAERQPLHEYILMPYQRRNALEEFFTHSTRRIGEFD